MIDRYLRRLILLFLTDFAKKLFIEANEAKLAGHTETAATLTYLASAVNKTYGRIDD